MLPDWDSIYRECYEPLVRFLHRKTWDEERARDLAQEVFVRGLRACPDSPRSWLFVVASNLARDEARTVVRRKRHLALLKTEADRTGEVVTPECELLKSEDERMLREALEALSEKDREVLLLWDAGLSYRDMAHASGLSPKAVGTTLVRARRRLLVAHAASQKRTTPRLESEGEHATR